MRQWLGVNPKILCKQHLIGEYREHFAFHGALRLQRPLDGYFRSNCLEPLSLQSRFDSLKIEMERRGYHTKSLSFPPELLAYLGHAKYIRADRRKNFNLLMSRCPKCVEQAISLNYLTLAQLSLIKAQAEVD